jgi:hypothetical protein
MRRETAAANAAAREPPPEKLSTIIGRSAVNSNARRSTFCCDCFSARSSGATEQPASASSPAVNPAKRRSNAII